MSTFLSNFMSCRITPSVSTWWSIYRPGRSHAAFRNRPGVPSRPPRQHVLANCRRGGTAPSPWQASRSVPRRRSLARRPAGSECRLHDRALVALSMPGITRGAATCTPMEEGGRSACSTVCRSCAASRTGPTSLEDRTAQRMRAKLFRCPDSEQPANEARALKVQLRHLHEPLALSGDDIRFIQGR